MTRTTDHPLRLRLALGGLERRRAISEIVSAYRASCDHTERGRTSEAWTARALGTTSRSLRRWVALYPALRRRWEAVQDRAGTGGRWSVDVARAR